MDEHNKFETLEALDALAQMPQLCHLLFETRPEAELGRTVAACLRRMPLLRRCGRRIDPSQLYKFEVDSDISDFCNSHTDALRQQAASGGSLLQLEEVFFSNSGSDTPLSEAVLRMPNLRTLVLDLGHWNPQLLLLLQNVTELCLLNATRSDAIQLLAAIGPQLGKLTILKVID